MSVLRSARIATRQSPLRTLASSAVPAVRYALPQARRAGGSRAIHSSSARRNASQPPTYAQLEEAVPEVSGLPASTDLLELYRGMVTAGRLKWDDEQVRCIIKVRLAPQFLASHSRLVWTRFLVEEECRLCS
jgi:hypothetical protein